MKDQKYEELVMEKFNEMTTLLALSMDVELKERGEDLVINIQSEEPGRIIGRRGQTLYSMQLLINRMLRKKDNALPRIILDVNGYKDERNANTSLSSQNKIETTPCDEEKLTEQKKLKKETAPYDEEKLTEQKKLKKETAPYDKNRLTEQKIETLKKLALDAAKEVKRWGEPVNLRPMDSKERKIIHMTLENEPDIQTESPEGTDDSMKRIIVKAK